MTTARVLIRVAFVVALEGLSAHQGSSAGDGSRNVEVTDQGLRYQITVPPGWHLGWVANAKPKQPASGVIGFPRWPMAYPPRYFAAPANDVAMAPPLRALVPAHPLTDTNPVAGRPTTTHVWPVLYPQGQGPADALTSLEVNVVLGSEQRQLSARQAEVSLPTGDGREAMVCGCSIFPNGGTVDTAHETFYTFAYIAEGYGSVRFSLWQSDVGRNDTARLSADQALLKRVVASYRRVGWVSVGTASGRTSRCG